MLIRAGGRACANVRASRISTGSCKGACHMYTGACLCVHLEVDMYVCISLMVCLHVHT